MDYQLDDDEAFIQQTPVILLIANFTKITQVWYGSPFLAFEKGYQMHFGVSISDNTNYISIGLQLMKGPYDDLQQQTGYFPMHRYFVVEFFSQTVFIPNHVEIMCILIL